MKIRVIFIPVRPVGMNYEGTHANVNTDCHGLKIGRGNFPNAKTAPTIFF